MKSFLYLDNIEKIQEFRSWHHFLYLDNSEKIQEKFKFWILLKI